MAEQLVRLVEKALKERILPAWNNQIGFEASPFLDKIKKVPLDNYQIRAAADIGINGGSAAGTENTHLPDAAPQMYEDFKIKPAYLYHTIRFSDFATQVANSAANSIIPVVKKETEGGYEACKWHLGRQLFMDGKGILANVTASDGTTNTVTVDSTKYLVPGLMVDFYTTGAAVGTEPTVGGRRILSINYASKTVTFDGTAVSVPGGFMTNQKSYGKEIFGLGALYDTTNITNVYGLTRSATTNGFLMPEVKSAENDISDIIIGEMIRNTRRIHGTKTDLVMMGDAAFAAYQTYMKVNNVQIVENLQFKGGFRGFEVLYGDMSATVLNEQFVPDNEVWGVDTKTFEWHSTGWRFATAEDSPAFQRDGAVYEALLANYGNLISTNPGGIWKLTNANANA